MVPSPQQPALRLGRRTVKADLSVLQDGETVMLSSNWQLPQSSWWRSFGIKDGWKPAEHVFLTVPALSHKHLVQAHPFTIASAAPTSADSHAWLNFLIRAQDGFSRDLLRYTQLHSSVNIRVDGPYGSSHALDMLHDKDVAVVVAGGSGIAVAFPLVWSLLKASAQDLELESNRQSKSRVSLIWVVHDQEHIHWIPQDRLDELRELGCKIMIPPPTRKAGRPDLPHLIEAAANAWNNEIEDPSVGVVVAGPDGMNRSCRNACADLGLTATDAPAHDPLSHGAVVLYNDQQAPDDITSPEHSGPVTPQGGIGPAVWVPCPAQPRVELVRATPQPPPQEEEKPLQSIPLLEGHQDNMYTSLDNSAAGEIAIPRILHALHKEMAELARDPGLMADIELYVYNWLTGSGVSGTRDRLQRAKDRVCLMIGEFFKDVGYDNAI
ncbi:ferric reductase-like transmembrane component, partial [Aureobasidium melanogenum]